MSISAFAVDDSKWAQETKEGQDALAQGRFDAAQQSFERAMKEAEKFKEKDPRLVTSMNNLASALHARGQFTEAVDLLDRALTIREKQVGKNSPQLSMLVDNLAAVYASAEQHAEESPYLERLVAIYEANLPQPKLFDAYKRLGLSYRSQKRDAEAEPIFRKAIKAAEDAKGPDNPDLIVPVGNLAEILAAAGKRPEAIALFDRQAGLITKTKGPANEELVAVYQKLAAIREASNETEAQEALLKKIVETQEKVSGPDSADLAYALKKYAVVLRKLGREKDAKKCEQRASDILGI